MQQRLLDILTEAEHFSGFWEPWEWEGQSRTTLLLVPRWDGFFMGFMSSGRYFRWNRATDMSHVLTTSKMQGYADWRRATTGIIYIHTHRHAHVVLCSFYTSTHITAYYMYMHIAGSFSRTLTCWHVRTLERQCFWKNIYMYTHNIPTVPASYLPNYLPNLLPCLPTYLPTHLPTYLPAYLPTCLPAYLPTCLPAYLPTCLPAYLPTCLPAYLPTSQPAYMPTCLHAYMPTYIENT